MLVGHDAHRRPAVDLFQPLENGPQKGLPLFGPRMSSIASTTTASTPSSPTHWGVISLGKARET